MVLLFLSYDFHRLAYIPPFELLSGLSARFGRLIRIQHTKHSELLL